MARKEGSKAGSKPIQTVSHTAVYGTFQIHNVSSNSLLKPRPCDPDNYSTCGLSSRCLQCGFLFVCFGRFLIDTHICTYTHITSFKTLFLPLHQQSTCLPLWNPTRLHHLWVNCMGSGLECTYALSYLEQFVYFWKQFLCCSQANLKLKILLPQPPKFWNCKRVQSCTAAKLLCTLMCLSSWL